MPVVAAAALVGGATVIASNNAKKGAKLAASAADKATDASLQIAREARDSTAKELRPWADAGADALAEIRNMLGLPPAPATTTNNGTGGGTGTGTGSGANASGVKVSPLLLAKFPELAELYGVEPPATNTSPPPPPPPPPPASPPSPPAPTGYEGSFYSRLVDDAVDSFEDSPWWQFAQEGTDRAIGEFNADAASSGLMLSGQALRARAEIAARMKGEAFDKHYNQQLGAKTDYLSALYQLSGQGMSAASGIGSGGQAFANTATNVLTNNARVQGEAAMAGANAQNSAISDLVGFGGWALGGMGSSPLNANVGSAFQQISLPTPTPLTPLAPAAGL